jgi:hypothetical protein
MRKLITTTVLGAALLGSSLLLSGPANASPSRFLTRADEDIPYVTDKYGDNAVLSEGYRICSYEQQGTTGASELADLITADMPMSRAAAIKMEVLAEVHLGC